MNPPHLHDTAMYPRPGLRPAPWNALRLKWLVDLVNVKTADTERQYVGLENVESWTGCRVDASSDSLPEGQSNLFESGDVLFGKLRPYLAKVYGANEPGRCTSELLVLRPKKLRADYLRYVLVAEPFISLVNSSTFGAKMPRADWEFIGRVLVPCPPSAVQHSIAEFLDRKTAAIDGLIRKKERLLSLSEERRAALVTNAVTKGLSPTVALTASGVPTIGTIPTGWSVTRLKFICSRIVDGVHATPEYVPAGIPFVTVKNLTSGAGVSLEDLNYVTPEDHAAFCKRAHPERGDILVTKDGTLGVCRVVETNEPFSIFVSVALLKPDRERIDSYFLRYGLESSFVSQQLESRRLGSALKHIHLEDLADLYFPLPPLHEQRRIAAHVREVAKREEHMAATLRGSIERLREYRQAIIAAAVTGELDVVTFPKEAA